MHLTSDNIEQAHFITESVETEIFVNVWTKSLIFQFKVGHILVLRLSMVIQLTEYHLKHFCRSVLSPVHVVADVRATPLFFC